MKYVSYLDGSSEFSAHVEWDFLVKDLIVKNYKENWTFCDVGSSEGEYTTFFNSLQNINTIYSFDINEKNIPLGTHHHEIGAVSDIDGTEPLYTHSVYPSKMSNIVGIDVDGNECIFVRNIPSIRLDTYFKDIHVNCLKIDVEGAEIKVIKGGLETIKKCDLVVIECHLDEDWPEMYHLLQNNDLEFFNIHDNEKISINIRPYQIYSFPNKANNI
jgi:FkbM family methyltransferase